MTLVFAHAGHWLESIVYLIPILGFAIWLAIIAIKDRRRGGSEGGDASV